MLESKQTEADPLSPEREPRRFAMAVLTTLLSLLFAILLILPGDFESDRSPNGGPTSASFLSDHAKLVSLRSSDGVRQFSTADRKSGPQAKYDPSTPGAVTAVAPPRGDGTHLAIVRRKKRIDHVSASDYDSRGPPAGTT